MIQNRRFNNSRINEFLELYHITVSIPIANKTLVDHDRFAKKRYERDIERCASRRQLSVSRECVKRDLHSMAVYGARVTLHPIGRRPETSWSRRHLIAGAGSAANPRDHEVSAHRPIERSVGCRCTEFAGSSTLRNARFSN